VVGCQEKHLLFERQEENLVMKDEELQAKQEKVQHKWDELLLQKKETKRSLSGKKNDRRVTSKEAWNKTTHNEKLDHKSLYR